MERLQKVLAQAGIASRRKCEEIITSGRVTIDGRPCTELGTRADPLIQRIAVDGVPIQLESTVCIILNKPTSYVSTTHDPEGRRTVMELVQDVPAMVHPVGRLDYDTTGLLLFTNDGNLTNHLLHPRHECRKVYRVTVVGMPDKEAEEQLRTGITLEDGVTAPAEVFMLRKHPKESVLEIALHEGRNRQVRRMFEAVNLPVKRLKRVQFGPIELTDVRIGTWRWLTRAEWKALYQSVKLEAPVYPAAAEISAFNSRNNKTKTDKGKRMRRRS